MNGIQHHELYKILARILYLAIGLYLLLKVLDIITGIILIFTVAGILAIALNPPVTWLESKHVPRVVGTLLVLVIIFTIISVLTWLVLPRLIDQISLLVASIPDYVYSLTNRVSKLVGNYPSIQERLQLGGETVRRLLPSAWTVLLRIGRYSLSALSLVVYSLLVILIIIYMLVKPKPLLKGYLDAMPSHLREPAVKAFAKSSEMVAGWVSANVIVGSIEALIAGVVLTLIGVPGALLWALLAFFSELIPQVGGYIMMIPPILVALALDPWMALWVFIFYQIMQAVMANVVAPVSRSSQMKIHPVSLLFAVLAMTALFGFLGAIIATPIAGFIKAYYEEFYLARQPEDTKQDKDVESMLSWWKKK